ncbi:serine hydrolase [Rhodococcus sp. NPDC127528]|uniref:serine hydrolase n=1 Tax=unclassified Rhodococcus (in: high G+C Gram-positive bacteria) TaxID=192944 RepID=UPI003636E436
MVKGRRAELTALCLAVAVAVAAVGALGGCAAVTADTATGRPSVAVPTDTPPATTDPPVPMDQHTLDDRLAQAVSAAAERSSEISIALLDRRTGQYAGSADTVPVTTASVAKLFIADSLLYGESSTRTPLSQDDRDLIERMLESSDDDAANELWNEHGASGLVTDVIGRYRLAATSAPYDDNWWNTATTPADLVGYYSGLLDGRGGLAPARREEMLGYLGAAKATAADGYHQRFGIPDGLPGESTVAVKQGWMCCIANQWLHLSTGVVGAGNRYVLVVASREDVDYPDGWPTVEVEVDDDPSDEPRDEPAATDEPTVASTPTQENTPVPTTTPTTVPRPHHYVQVRQYPDTTLTTAADDASAAHARETMTEVVRILFPEGRID